MHKKFFIQREKDKERTAIDIETREKEKRLMNTLK